MTDRIQLNFRLSEEDKKLLDEAVEQSPHQASRWIRDALMKAALEELKECPTCGRK